MALDVLVTGANGALGSAIVSELRARNKTVCAVGHFQKNNLDAVWDLTRDRAPSADCAPRVVIHAAARIGSLQQPFSDTSALFETNVMGSLRVAQWCIEKRVTQLIYISGAIVYGAQSDSPKTEQAAVNAWAAGPYAASKWCGENALMGLAQSDCALTILRLSSLYGALYTRGLIPRMLRRARATGEIILTPPRDDAFDLLHTQDAARTICNAMTKKSSGIWNIGSGTLTQLDTLAAACARATNARVIWQDVQTSRPARILNWVDDNLARRELAHANRVALKTGIAEIVTQLCQAPA